MSCRKLFLPLLFSALAFSSTAAQDDAPIPPARPRSRTAGLPGTTGTTGTGSGSHLPGRTNPNRKEPCWQVAGVSRSLIQQRQALQRQARQEIEAVCSTASLSITQKRERIHQIRQQERAQVDGLISPQQQEAIRACQESRGHGGGGGGRISGGHAGPCGTIPGFAEHEMEAEPKD
jgi:hypothetical protein